MWPPSYDNIVNGASCWNGATFSKLAYPTKIFKQTPLTDHQVTHLNHCNLWSTIPFISISYNVNHKEVGSWHHQRFSYFYLRFTSRSILLPNDFTKSGQATHDSFTSASHTPQPCTPPPSQKKSHHSSWKILEKEFIEISLYLSGWVCSYFKELRYA